MTSKKRNCSHIIDNNETNKEGREHLAFPRESRHPIEAAIPRAKKKTNSEYHYNKQ